MLSAYPACFIKEDTAYSVIFPDLNTATCGDNLEDALSMAVDCLAGYLYSANLEGESVPPASSLQDIDIQKVMDELEVISEPGQGTTVLMSKKLGTLPFIDREE